MSLEKEEGLVRHFTHLTIPAEIWLRRDISLQAKCLWAEIRSLHDPVAGGCYASDEYLGEFMDLKRSRLHELYKELKEKELLEVVSFDGRRIVRRAIVPEIKYDCKPTVSGKPDTLNPGTRTTGIRKAGHPTYIEKKEENKEDKKYAPPSGSATHESFSPTLSSKKELKAPEVSVTPEEHEKLIKDFGKDIVEKGYLELSEWKKSADPKQVKKHSSDYYRLRKWVIPDLKNNKERKNYYGNSSATTRQNIRDKQLERWEKTNGSPDDSPNIIRFD